MRKKLNRCYEECKDLQSHSHGLDEHKLHSVIIWSLLVTVTVVRHTVLMPIVEMHLKQEVSFEVTETAFS